MLQNMTTCVELRSLRQKSSE